MPNDNAYSSRGSFAPGPYQKPTVRERGRMRRRLREQQRIREALLLDLGALVLELHRHGRRAPELLQAKAAELSAVDHEVRALAHALDTGQTALQLVSAGIAGSCGSCGSLLSTDARYCSACGAAAVPALAGDPSRREPALGAGDPHAAVGLEAGGQDDAGSGALERIRGRLRRGSDG